MVKVHGKHPVRIVVVFLIGLHVSARITACCACPGVGFIVIPFSCFLRMQDVARTSNSRTSSLAEAQGRPGQEGCASFALQFNLLLLGRIGNMLSIEWA